MVTANDPILAGHYCQVLFNDIPFRTVEAKRLAGMAVEFHQANVGKAGLLKAERLAASACTQFEN